MPKLDANEPIADAGTGAVAANAARVDTGAIEAGGCVVHEVVVMSRVEQEQFAEEERREKKTERATTSRESFQTKILRVWEN